MTLPAWRVEGDPRVGRPFAESKLLACAAVAVANRTRRPIPPLYASGITYRLTARGQNAPVPWWECHARGYGDCQTLTAWRAAERREASGSWPTIIGRDAGPTMLHVLLDDEDPSRVLYMAGRWNPARGARDVAGERWDDRNAGAGVEAGGPDPRSKDPANLDPRLQAALARAEAAGIRVGLTSGWRPIARQIELFEERAGYPRWSDVEADYPAFYTFVHDVARGKHGSALAIPGRSRHNRYPAFAMDLSGDVERFAVAEKGRLHRPIAGESWHFEPIGA